MVQGSNRGMRAGRLAAFAALALMLVAVAVWWFAFRDTAPAAVDSAAQAEARQQGIDEALAEAAQAEAGASDATGDPEPTAAADDATTAEVGSGQPDSAASLGSRTDGVWVVDTSIGTFGPECLDVVCTAGFVGFRIDEELAGFGAKTVVGRTPAVSGEMMIQGTQVTAAAIVADMTQILTDDDGRTQAIKGPSGGLETNTFPEASFVLAEPIEMGQVPVEGAAVQFDAVGDLTVHGVTRRVTISLTAEQQAGLISVFGNLTDIVLADFDIPKPSAVVVLSVEETATMEFQLFFNR